MSVVIRTLYHNQGWCGPCRNPYQDANFSASFYKGRQIEEIPSPEKQNCDIRCWEKYLCGEKYRWGATPKGNVFRRIIKGDKVYFIFPQPNSPPRDRLYTLWGVAEVESVDTQPEEDGYAYVHFTKEFKPLPKEQWVPNLTAEELVSAPWRQNAFRYIGLEKESYLDSLIKGDLKLKRPEIQLPIDVTISIKLKKHIYEKLCNISSLEGRSLEDIIREAIAEFISGR